MGWAEMELEGLDLGDARLDKRAVMILNNFGFAPGKTIPQTCKTWGETKACYNFFSNATVSCNKILKPHKDKTISRMKDCPVVLLPSDTTRLDYTTKKAMQGKERLTQTRTGLWLHPTIAVTPKGLMLGVLETNFWHRESEVGVRDSTARDNTSIKKKESYRWLKSYKTACSVAHECPDTQLISIFDREGDIIEVYEEAEKQESTGYPVYFIIRSQHDRLLEKNDGEKKLRAALKAAAPLGELEFDMPSRGDRKGRKVKQEIKAISVVVVPRKKNKKVKVNAVMAIEKDPPPGEDPIIWILITNLPVDSFEDAVKVIQFYLCRWSIELFFKVLKSGCKIEERQLQSTTRMKPLIAIFMILAWRIMFTMMIGRVDSEMPCTKVFEDAEWKSVYKVLNKNKYLPRQPPSLGAFIMMIAKLGGYVEKDGEDPGVKVMWRGMARMVDFSLAWEAFAGRRTRPEPVQNRKNDTYG